MNEPAEIETRKHGQFDGGPAFPRQHTVADANDNSFKIGSEGMSLRDYFAAAALTGLVGTQMRIFGAHNQHASAAQELLEKFSSPNGFAQMCYATADAMLAARDAQLTSASSAKFAVPPPNDTPPPGPRPI